MWWKLEHFSSALTHKKLVVDLVKSEIGETSFVPAPGAGETEWDENNMARAELWVSGARVWSGDNSYQQHSVATTDGAHTLASSQTVKYSVCCVQMLANINVLWSRLINIRHSLDEKVKFELDGAGNLQSLIRASRDMNKMQIGFVSENNIFFSS